jgi:hypothetical protein
MSSAGDDIRGALRLIGQLAEGETPSSETMDDALTALNTMLDSWSAERLSVFSTQDQTVTWPPGSINESLGPTGSLGTNNRPVLLDDSTYFRDPSTGISYGIKIINQQQYDGIAVKTVTSSYPQVLWYNADMPNIDIFIYPVPTRVLEWHFISVTELTQPATLATDIIVPPGYRRAYRFNLAVEIAAEFGVEPPPTVGRIAVASKRVLKRINNPEDVMSMPYPIVATRQRYSIYAGNF